MSSEKGEALRLCPAKVREEDDRIASHYMGTAFLGPPILIGDAPERKEPKELACPDDCPGKVIKERRLFGFIPLPSVEVCPMNPDAPTRNILGL